MSICSPRGLECYENINLNKSNCLTPCFGIFADIHQSVSCTCYNEFIENTLYQIEETAEEGGLFVSKEVLREYEDYKRGWSKEVDYPQQIIGRQGEYYIFEASC